MHYMTETVATLVLLLFQEERGHEMTGHFWEPWILFPLLFFGGLVALVAWLVVRIFPRAGWDERLGAARDSAEEILRERFARGEITDEEYQKSIKILRGENAGEVPDDTQRAE